MSSSGTFTKQLGGLIYGSDGETLKNSAKSEEYGHVVYTAKSNTSYKRNTTAGIGVILDSSISGSAGGWE